MGEGVMVGEIAGPEVESDDLKVMSLPSHRCSIPA